MTLCGKHVRLIRGSTASLNFSGIPLAPFEGVSWWWVYAGSHTRIINIRLFLPPAFFFFEVAPLSFTLPAAPQTPSSFLVVHVCRLGRRCALNKFGFLDYASLI